MALPYKFNRQRYGSNIGNETAVNPMSGHQTATKDLKQNLNQSVPVEQGNTGFPVINPQSSNISTMDTSSIDFGNKQQVQDIQTQLANQGYLGESGNALDIDGIWGPETEYAWRDMIKQRRMAGGLDEYQYNDMPVNVPTPAPTQTNLPPGHPDALIETGPFEGTTYEEFWSDPANYRGQSDASQAIDTFSAATNAAQKTPKNMGLNSLKTWLGNLWGGGM